MSSVKLNIFQRGALQKGATAFVYLVSIAIGAFILDWLDKRLFIRLAEEAQQRGILSPDASRSFTTLIGARDSTTIFAIILVGLGCGFVGWLFMRWAAKRNWSWPVMLPRAVEFRSAMERLGIVDPDDRIAFVRKYKLPVFFAPNPIVGMEQKKFASDCMLLLIIPLLGIMKSLNAMQVNRLFVWMPLIMSAFWKSMARKPGLPIPPELPNWSRVSRI